MIEAVPIPPIDPVELMLVSVGIRAIISREIEKITKGQLDDMVKLPAKVLRLSRQIVAGEEFEPTFGQHNYRALLSELASGWDVEQVQKMLENVPSEYHVIASALIVKSAAIIKQMDKEYPVSSYVTVAGDTKLTPPDTKMFRFISVLECLDHPLVVFELMSTGALLQSQAQAVRAIYPSLSAAIDMSIFDSVSRAKAAKKSYQLPSRAERGVRAWFGKGPIDIKSMVRAQVTAKENIVKEKARQQANAQSNQDKMTQVQRVDKLA